ncbi:hypothetical protein [Mesorhizobium sp. M8A.F.Ca.ET.021.01.1.1]|uniref:hypothetical protein n=1 Tax=Mesorhizobium sp. M8A.F.Ca.ET.021.01.1.1 TaxID=2496757 RepID=UPI000FD5E1B7|nr:hypothetical protein [Mesorhizobium sp. M8A.F.Ca.ET.021.01.1.1]RUW56381.1 hypothetical protein EOA36_04540 [Mesorhizobium sp. M8A.F.Ca.ET.021.01.1.1]
MSELTKQFVDIVLAHVPLAAEQDRGETSGRGHAAPPSQIQSSDPKLGTPIGDLPKIQKPARLILVRAVLADFRDGVLEGFRLHSDRIAEHDNVCQAILDKLVYRWSTGHFRTDFRTRLLKDWSIRVSETR